MTNHPKIAVIGGGASGFFSAIHAKLANPMCEVILFEKSNKLLAKVKISGGGRCNVTHELFDNQLLSKKYPRGEKQLRSLLNQFDVKDTLAFFESRGVKLHTLPDGCIFPVANTSQVIIDCFLNEVRRLKIEIRMQQIVSEFTQRETGWTLKVNEELIEFDKVIIATGGHPKYDSYGSLLTCGFKVISPVPSLFTFNMPENPIRSLMGIVVENAMARIEGTKLIGKGPLLITHWGMSGPCILQLSAWGARILEEKKYNVHCLVNWVNVDTEAEGKLLLDEIIKLHGAKKITNFQPNGIKSRLWEHLLERTGISNEFKWNDIRGKWYHKLLNTLLNDRYEVSGKTTFKEEFVTAGGIDLNEINIKTMESKHYPGMFFAGEVLDIDGITGGFNFQAAWTTGAIAGRNAGAFE